MKVELFIEGHDMQHAQLELLLKINAQQKTLMDLLGIILGKDHIVYERLKLSAADLTVPDIYIDGVAAMQNKQLDLLLEILASVRSISALLIDGFAQNEFQENEYVELVEKCKLENYNRIFYDLYERRGTIAKEIYQQLQTEGKEISETRAKYAAAGKPVTARRASAIVLLKKLKNFFYK